MPPWHEGLIKTDVSAWSIERENPLYLPQSKIYAGCCALGPVLATADEIPDPRELELRCRILRAGQCRFEGAASVGLMKRSIPELVDWLLRCNDVPEGTVLLTGTGIIVPPEMALAAGDVVEISCDAIGTLRNPCQVIPVRERQIAQISHLRCASSSPAWPLERLGFRELQPRQSCLRITMLPPPIACGSAKSMSSETPSLLS